MLEINRTRNGELGLSITKNLNMYVYNDEDGLVQVESIKWDGQQVTSIETDNCHGPSETLYLVKKEKELKLVEYTTRDIRNYMREIDSTVMVMDALGFKMGVSGFVAEESNDDSFISIDKAVILCKDIKEGLELKRI